MARDPDGSKQHVYSSGRAAHPFLHALLRHIEELHAHRVRVLSEASTHLDDARIRLAEHCATSTSFTAGMSVGGGHWRHSKIRHHTTG